MPMTPEQKTQAITLASTGVTLKRIREQIGCTDRAWYAALEHDLKFGADMDHARDRGYDELGDSLLDMSTDNPDVQVARLKSDNIRWLISKRASRRYGDKLDINVTGVVDLAGALIEGQKRAGLAPIGNPAIAPPSQQTEYTEVIGMRPADSQSVDAPHGDDYDIFS